MTREEAKDLLLNISAYDIDMQRGMAKQEAIDMAIKALEQEPCEDAISRTEAIRVASGYCHWSNIPDELAKLPSVSTEKTGRWEWNQYDYNPNLGNWHCSECRSIVIECVPKKDPSGVPLYKYCPNCGCRMMEVEE